MQLFVWPLPSPISLLFYNSYALLTSDHTTNKILLPCLKVYTYGSKILVYQNPLPTQLDLKH